MRRLTRLFGFAFAISIIMWAVTSHAQQAAPLEALKQSFQKQDQALSTDYAATLDKQMVELKKKGDLDAYLLVEAEKKRFDVDKTVPLTTEAKASFRDACEAHHKAKLELYKKYLTALDGQIKKSMQADKMDDAKAAKAEKETIAFVLADLETKLPKPVAAVESKPAPAAATPRKKEMNLTTSQMDRGKWKTSRLAVAQGTRINVQVKPGVSMQKKGNEYIHESVKVRVGDTGKEYFFDTTGRHNWKDPGRDWQSEPALAYIADVPGEIFIAHFQDLNIKVTITVDP